MSVQSRKLHGVSVASGLAGLTLLAVTMAVSAAQTTPPTTQPPAAPVNPRCAREEFDIDADCIVEGAKSQKSARETAPVDLVGYWTSIVSEEWRWRMMTPPKGDRASMPLSAKAREEMNRWDPAKPEQCKAFGAPGLLRNPMRVHFTWVDDNNLRMETDHGQVTRDFHFGNAQRAVGDATMQGDSVASWEGGGLKVVTTHLKGGFLRKNGVPYSEQTVLTEYFDRYSAAGHDYVTVTAVVQDPVYLTREFIVTTDFKSLADGSSWRPTPCDAPLKLPAQAKR